MGSSLRLLSVTAGAALALALGLAGCSPGGAAEAAGTSCGSPGAQAEPSITFERNGSFTGSDGCNHLGGKWRMDGSVVELDDMAMTLIGCPDIDTWLSRAASAVIANDTIVFRDEREDEIGSLGRFDG